MSIELSEIEKDRIIEMAWEDRTPFEAITIQFGLPEKEVIKLMRGTLKRSSFNLWRKRVNSGSVKNMPKSATPKSTDLNARYSATSQVIKSRKDKLIAVSFCT